MKKLRTSPPVVAGVSPGNNVLFTPDARTLRE
jgi:hypothetical protein